MKCAWCNKLLDTHGYISFARKCFCSDVCQLKYHKQELPNLGGSAITDDDIDRIQKASGEERKKQRQELFLKTMKAFDESDFWETLEKGV